MCENKQGDKCAINNGDCIGEFECERAKLLDEILELRQKVKDLQVRKDRYYLQTLEYERQISDYNTLLRQIKDLCIEQIEIQDAFRYKTDSYMLGRDIVTRNSLRQFVLEILKEKGLIQEDNQ